MTDSRVQLQEILHKVVIENEKSGPEVITKRLQTQL